MRDTGKNLRIAVFGHATAKHLSEPTLQWTETLGILIADAGATLYTGGGGGVMLAARRGCLAHGGAIVSVNPEMDISGDIARSRCLGSVIAAGQGKLGRVHLLTQSIDLGFAVGGGAGTLLEIVACYLLAKPVVVVNGFQSDKDPCVDALLTRRTEELIAGVPVMSGCIDAKDIGQVCPVRVCPKSLSPEVVFRIGLEAWLARGVKSNRMA